MPQSPTSYQAKWDFDRFSSYQDYIHACQRMIEQSAQLLHPTMRTAKIEANQPREFISNNFNSDTGILLIHGLFNSPYSMHSLFEYFQQRNYSVRNLLLPGHGGNENDQLSTDASDWIAATQFAIQCFSQEVKKLFIIGHSTGGLLGLDQALHYPIVKGVVALAPPLRIDHFLILISPWLDKLTKPFPKWRWWDKVDHWDYSNQHSFSIHAIAQVYRYGQQFLTRWQQRQHDFAKLLVATETDETVDTYKIVQFFSEETHPLSQMIWYGNRKKISPDHRIIIRPSVYEEERILSIPHRCLPIGPDHLFYGKNSGYMDIDHYFSCRKRKWWNLAQPIYLGSPVATNIQQKRIARLSYNPDFAFMVEQIERFITTV